MSLVDLLYSNWSKLGGVGADELVDARLNAHHAVQVAAAVGHSFIPPLPDDSHSSVEWLDRLQGLVGNVAPGGYRVGLKVRDLRLLLLDKDGREYATQNMEGRTLKDCFQWLRSEIADAIGAAPPREWKTPDYDMPAHGVAEGGRFETNSAELGELARWFGNADRALQLLAGREEDASQVRCWPHRFDITTLLNLDEYEPKEKQRTIGIGMSPGDDSYRQPYFYATPWPYPDQRSLPALASGGTWHREGWTGAVLTGSKITSVDSAERQSQALAEFLESALAACRTLLSE